VEGEREGELIDESRSGNCLGSSKGEAVTVSAIDSKSNRT